MPAFLSRPRILAILGLAVALALLLAILGAAAHTHLGAVPPGTWYHT